ncbi:hypothetical protein [Leeia oryzae]|uniref:hypothetical protein n=1 Tax=Leeia oryzae TaxID=356662 RepID=UPI00037C5DA3|nr:hypothetical protein [Leeia oryzae]
MKKQSLICIMLSAGLLAMSAADASPAEDEVQHAQLWRDMKNNEADSAVQQHKDAEFRYQQARKKLEEAQKAVDEAQKERERLARKEQDAQAQLKAADARLDKAWKVLEQERKGQQGQ